MQQYLRRPGVRLPAFVIALALFSGMLLLSEPTFARADTSVSVVDNSFSPQTISIAPGETVTWHNNGTMQHTVTADNGLFGSGTMLPGDTYTRTFNSAGSFPYYCQLHGSTGGGGMSGTVVVDGSLASSTVSTTTASGASATTTTSTSTSSSGTSTTTATTTALVVSGGSVTPNSTGAIISWTTNANSDARITFGRTIAYTSTTTSDNMLVTSHSVMVSGLTPSTLYHFRAVSAANGAVAMSPDMTFTTTGTSSTSTPTSTSTPLASGTTTSGTTTPYYVDFSSLRTQIAQLDASIRALQVQLQIILVGNPSVPPPPGVTSSGGTSNSGAAVYADDYSVTSSAPVHVNGSGFGANEQITISAENILVGHAETDASGAFAATLSAPSSSGDTTYWFSGQSSGVSDSLDITLVSDTSSDSNDADASDSGDTSD